MIAFKPTQARFVRITSTASAPNAAWSITNLRLFEAGK